MNKVFNAHGFADKLLNLTLAFACGFIFCMIVNGL